MNDNKPNILIFMTDQQRGATVLAKDPLKAKTPVLDEFRKDSVTFTQAYCPSPHCCPSRATFHTGLYPTQHGVWNNVDVANSLSRGLKKHIRPWSMDMVEAGYKIYFSGKWHVSSFQSPEDYGWDIVSPQNARSHYQVSDPYTLEMNAIKNETDYLNAHAYNNHPEPRKTAEIIRDGYPPYVHYGSKENPFDDETVTNYGVETLLKKCSNSSEPWALFVGTVGPHDPYMPPQRFIDMYEGEKFELPETFHDLMQDKPSLYRRTRDCFFQLSEQEHREAIKHYLAFCSYEDWLFGKLIDALKQTGQYDNTIILYTSDHGDYVGDHGLWCKGLPSFTSNYHIPAIMRIPAQEDSCRGLEIDEFVTLADFGPTFLDILGIESETKFAGCSLTPFLYGNKPQNWRDALFFQSNGNETYGIQRSILTKEWRFVYNGFDYDELYDLKSDPMQMKNLASDPKMKSVIKEMYQRYWEFGLSHGEQNINDYIMTALYDFGPGVALPDSVKMFL